MSVTVTLTLDDEAGAYLERIASDQGRTPSEVAAWMLAEDLRHERAVDADLVRRLDSQLVEPPAPSVEAKSSLGTATHAERAGA